jgi:CRISPR type III-B/RAMP module-associated protein Cmr5
MTASSGRQTLDQLRAAHAWRAVEHAQGELGPNAHKEFGRPAKKLGPRILTAGLGPALSFLIAKKEAPKLVEALENWLLEAGPTRTEQPAQQRRSQLVEHIINRDSDRLRWLTAEALAYVAWLTRFCEARDLTDDEQ